MKYLKLGLVLVLAIGLGSCWPRSTAERPISSPLSASPSPSPEALVPVTACELVTKEDVAAVVGEPMLDPKQSEVVFQGDVAQQSCLYLAQSNQFSPTVQITIRYIDLENQQPILDYWLATEASASALPRYQKIDNLGQRAYFAAQHLHILQGEYATAVVVAMPDPDQNRPVAQELAETIVTRLNSSLNPSQGSEAELPEN